MEYKRGARAPRSTEDDSAWLRASTQGATEAPKLHLRWLGVARLANMSSMLKPFDLSVLLLGLAEGANGLDSTPEKSAHLLESNEALGSVLPSAGLGFLLSIAPVWTVGAHTRTESSHVFACKTGFALGFAAAGYHSCEGGAGWILLCALKSGH